MQVCKYAGKQVCMYPCMWVWKYASMQVRKCISMQVCIYINMHECKCTSMQVCMHTNMQECKYASIQVCKYVWMYGFMQVCKHGNTQQQQVIANLSKIIFKLCWIMLVKVIQIMARYHQVMQNYCSLVLAFIHCYHLPTICYLQYDICFKHIIIC